MESLRKSKKKDIPKSINEMSKEMLQQTLKKKKECNTKALGVVEKLCEVDVDESYFLANLQFINQCHFDDITVERAISKMCGYPLCDQVLTKVPAQQYHISTRYNKVFDITERKNFCSSNCYKSAMHVKTQLFTSPLWLRDKEVIPKFTVLKSSQSSMGEEVVFFPDKIKPEPEDVKEINKITLNENITKLEEKYSSLNIIDSKEESNDKIEIQKGNTKSCADNVSNVQKAIKAKEQDKAEDNQSDNAVKDIVIQKIKNDSKDKYIMEETKTKIENKPTDVVTKVENSIFEWFSLDTIFYLYETEKLKELFQDKFVKMEELINSKLLIPGSNQKIDKMIQLYGLLDTDSFNNRENKMNLKPLPDYSTLKEEGKSLEIKVRAFYQGNLEVSTRKEEVNTEHEESKTNSNPTYLPLIDSHAQVALRKKIVLDKLNKVLPELIKAFCSDFVLKMSEVRDLVSTFSLSAHNITFKPSEWYLIGTIIIKLLSLRDKELNSAMKLDSSENQILLILSGYDLKKDYLDDLIHRLTISENLLSKLNEINR